MNSAPPDRFGHGTAACYKRGCRRTECSDAHYRYMSRWRLDDARGQRRRTDAQPAREHAHKLLNAGWLQSQIGDAAGLNHRVIASLIVAEFPTISRRTAAGILALPISAPPRQRDVDATGTVRRLRALMAIGWPLCRLAPQIGLHHTAVGIIARGERQLVRAATADAVATAYRRLAAVPGTSTRARRTAAANRWPDPAFWEDWGGIDDPNAPETEPAVKRGSQAEARYRAEEIRHLAGCGISHDEIAARLSTPSQKVTAKYVKDIITGTRAPGWRQQLREAA